MKERIIAGVGLDAVVRKGRGQARSPGPDRQAGATVFQRLKRWLFGMLAMLALKGVLHVARRACGAAA